MAFLSGEKKPVYAEHMVLGAQTTGLSQQTTAAAKLGKKLSLVVVPLLGLV